MDVSSLERRCESAPAFFVERERREVRDEGQRCATQGTRGAKGKGAESGSAPQTRASLQNETPQTALASSLKGEYLWQKRISTSRHSAMCASWSRSRIRRAQWHSPPLASKTASREDSCPYLNRCTRAAAKHGRRRFRRARPCKPLWRNPRSTTTNARFSNSRYV